MVKNWQKEFKILWRPFLIVFLTSFLIFNWNNISWIFNYKIISGFFSSIFSQEFAGTITAGRETKGRETESEIFPKTSKEDSLEIPRMGTSAPLILVSEKKEVYPALDRGVVLFPSSVFPGEVGQTIILGHSAPLGWPKIKYQWVFSQINDLERGDEVFVYFDNKKYTYSVSNKIFLEKGERLPDTLTNSENVLILISCWPPGKDIKRIAVEAVLKK